MMRISCCVWLIGSLALGLSPAWAESPATTQTSHDLSPQEQLLAWQDEFDQGPADQVMHDYAVHTDAQRSMADTLAKCGVSGNRLIKLARKKFGPVAEVAVAHICSTDCRADDKNATVKTIDDSHAVIAFSSDAITDLLMVREDGQWKIDTAGYEKQYGTGLAIGLKQMRLSIPIMDKAAEDLNNGKYASAQALLDDLAVQFNALQAEMDKLSRQQ